jgi:hypothetical protein
VRDDGDDHRLRRPAVRVAQEHAERDGEFEVLDVAVREADRRAVVEHQHDARYGQKEIKSERYPAHAPRVRPLERARADLDRVQVQPDVADDVARAVARRVLPQAAAEDGPPQLGVDDLFFDLLNIKGRHDVPQACA